jgi:asparagine synthetase B (glutamine-hydrolysing)
MPGILGIVQSRGNEASAPLDEAVRRLTHLDGYVSKQMPLGPVRLAQVWRGSRGVEADWSFDGVYQSGTGGGVAVLVNGHVLRDGTPPRRLYGRDILETYRKEGRVPAVDYDGAFVIAVADLQRKRLFLYNDRLGTLPVCYTQSDGIFCFAPEAKAVLALAEKQAKLSQRGVVSFFSIGYCLGETTLFEDIKMLEPGCVLTVDLESAVVRRERYWTMAFDPANAIRSRRAAEDAMYEALLRSHELLLCDGPRHFEVMLSGGLDSRAVPAFMNELKHPPSTSFTWGVDDNFPYSDASQARKVSELFGVPLRFFAYDTDQFVDNAREWAWISELANDNVGWFAEGAPVLSSGYNRQTDFMIAGDVAWDCAGYAFYENDPADFILGTSRVPPELTSCMNDSAARDADDVFADEVQTLLRRIDTDDLTKRKDLTYLYGRMARFLFSLGYYKELAVQLRRPFLTIACFDLLARLPEKLRNYKDVYVTMMNRRFRGLMAIEENAFDSLPDWEYDVRKKTDIRRFFESRLRSEALRGGVLSGMMDWDRFDAFVQRFFDAPVGPVSRVRHNSIRHRMRKRAARFVRRHRALEKTVRTVKKADVVRGRSHFDIVRCAALISLLEDQLPAFDGGNVRSG